MRLLLILGCLSLFCVSNAQSPSKEVKPNFVIIFTDDQGYADLSCFGGEHVKTPQIDKMAAPGSPVFT